jgi:polysaccharide export outer membrane protein
MHSIHDQNFTQSLSAFGDVPFSTGCSWPSAPTAPRIVLIGVLILLSAGCHRAQIYQASALPIELTAPPVLNPLNIDFSKLARNQERSETLHSGDVVDVQITTGIEEEEPVVWKVRLDEQGVGDIPIIGPVRLAGLDFTGAGHAIRVEGIQRGKYVAPNVSVSLRERRTIRVTVLGAVAKQGDYNLPAADANLLAALSKAENLTEEASTIIEIRHPPRRVMAASFPAEANTPRLVTVDLAQAELNQNVDLRIEDGTTVMVRPRAVRFISVIGLVKKSGQFKMPMDRDIRLLEAISLGEGRVLQLADKVHIIRQGPGDVPVVIEASIKAAKTNPKSNIRLADGDVISVEETSMTFVVGMLRDFVRLGFTSGIPGF